MGYRSDVRIITTMNGYEELKKFVDSYCKEKKCYNLLEALDVDKLTDTSDKLIGWDYVKWYDDLYDDVIAINEGLSHIANLGYAYNFARIGEDFDDYETEEKFGLDGDCVPNIYITRSFDYSY